MLQLHPGTLKRPGLPPAALPVNLTMWFALTAADAGKNYASGARSSGLDAAVSETGATNTTGTQTLTGGASVAGRTAQIPLFLFILG